ncbi:MAG: hypothetical protein ACFFFK_08890, partial [Candidatus Thorarchaeota archaeon]
LSSWWVDNQEFSVDSVGRVRNLVKLAPGDHTVTVFVSDNNDNVLQATFTVHVGSPFITDTSGTPSIIDSAILFGAGVVATAAVAVVVCAIGRRKPVSSK